MEKIQLTDEEKEILGIEDERVNFYFTVENDIIDKAPLDNVYELALMTVLSRYCNNGNLAYPSLKTLSELCYCSKSTTVKNLESLEEKGLVKRVQRYCKETKTNLTTVYKIQNINTYTKEKKVVREVDKGCIGERQGVYREVDKGCTGERQGVYREMDKGCPPHGHNKELSIKNYIINTSSRNEKEVEKNVRRKFEFLENYKNISVNTCRNIRKNIPELTEEKLKEVIALIENQGNIKNFNGALYQALKGEWDFSSSKTTTGEIQTVDQIEEKIKTICNVKINFLNTPNYFNSREEAIREFLRDTNKYSTLHSGLIKLYCKKIEECRL